MYKTKVYPIKVFVEDKTKYPLKKQTLNAKIPYNYTVEEVIDYFNNTYGIGTSYNIFEQKTNKRLKPNEHISKYIPPFVLSSISDDEDIKQNESEEQESSEIDSDCSYPTLDKIIDIANKKEEREKKHLLKKKKERDIEEKQLRFQPDDEEEFMKLFTETVKYAKCFIVKGNNRDYNTSNNKIISKYKVDTGKTAVNIEELCENNSKKKYKEEITKVVKEENIKFEEEKTDDEDLEIVEDINAFVKCERTEIKQEKDFIPFIPEFKDIQKERVTEEEIIPQCIPPKKEKPIVNEKKEKDKIDYFSQIKAFFNKHRLTKAEKNKVKSIFTSIQNTPLPRSNYRINIVLDLDNTVLFSQLVMNNSDIDDKDVLTYCLMNHSNIIKGKFVFRPGLKEFFDATKDFADYYVYSLGIENYVKCLVEELENKFSIRIKRMMWRNDSLGNFKYLEFLNIDSKKTIIIDDQNGPWKMPTNSNNHSIRILNSYRYLNAFYLNHCISLFNFQDFGTLNYTNLSNSLFTLEPKTNICKPLPTDNTNIPFYIEHEFSPKHQFDYFGNVFKQIYKCAVIGKFQPILSLAITRYCTLMNNVFCLGFCIHNYNELRDMVISCGGEITDDKFDPNLTHFVVDRSGYSLFINDDKKMNGKLSKNKFVVNPKYIFDCFYLVDKMKESDSEYGIDKLI